MLLGGRRRRGWIGLRCDSFGGFLNGLRRRVFLCIGLLRGGLLVGRLIRQGCVLGLDFGFGEFGCGGCGRGRRNACSLLDLLDRGESVQREVAADHFLPACFAEDVDHLQGKTCVAAPL